MKHRFPNFRWTPGMRAASGVYAAALVITLGVVGVVAAAAGFAYAASDGTQAVHAAPLLAGVSPHPDGLATKLIANSGDTDDVQGSDPGGAGQETSPPGVTTSTTSLVIPEGDQATYTVRLNARPADMIGVLVIVDGNQEVVANPTVLNFAPDEWNDPQMVTLTTQADADDRPHYGSISHVGPGADGMPAVVAEVAVVVTDGCDAIWCGVMEMTKTLPYEMEFVSLDDDEFTDAGTTHRVRASHLHSRVLPGEEARPPFSIPERTSLRLWLDGGLAGTNYYSNWTLYLNGIELPFHRARVVFDDLPDNRSLLFKWYALGLHRLLPAGIGEQAASWYLRIEDTGDPVAQPPGPPLYLRLLEAHPRPQELTLLWNRPHTMDDYYHELTEFNVQWKRSDGSWDTPGDVSEASVETIGQSTHAHRIQGLDGGVEYDLRVVAVNAVGAGEPSEVLSAVAPPAVP